MFAGQVKVTLVDVDETPVADADPTVTPVTDERPAPSRVTVMPPPAAGARYGDVRALSTGEDTDADSSHLAERRLIILTALLRLTIRA